MGTCKDSDVIIPASYQGLPVTQIRNIAFYNCKQITSVTIPTYVTSIGNYAFEFCENLTSITISNSVIRIGDGAFYNCYKLTSITFQGTVDEWNAIEKDPDWDSYTGNYTIYCTDGEITK